MTNLAPLTLELRLGDLLNQNAIQGKNGHAVNRLVQPVKDLAQVRFREAYGPHSKRAPVFQRVHVTALVAWPDRVRRDTMNWYPTAKAVVDGFTNAGLVPDDKDQHLVGPHLFPSAELSGRRGVYLFTFQFQDLGAAWTTPES